MVTGGVWRRLDSDPDVRNDYLVVEARTADGLRVPVTISSEEYGTTDQVFEWGERVPRDVYDGVGADKQDNGIIDDAPLRLQAPGVRDGRAPLRGHRPDHGVVSHADGK